MHIRRGLCISTDDEPTDGTIALHKCQHRSGCHMQIPLERPQEVPSTRVIERLTELTSTARATLRIDERSRGPLCTAVMNPTIIARDGQRVQHCHPPSRSRSRYQRRPSSTRSHEDHLDRADHVNAVGECIIRELSLGTCSSAASRIAHHGERNAGRERHDPGATTQCWA